MPASMSCETTPAPFQLQNASGKGSLKPARWKPLSLNGPYQKLGEWGGAAWVLELQNRPLFSLQYINQAAVSWRTLETQTMRRASSRALPTAGRRMEMSSVIIPITTKSLTIVNALCKRCDMWRLRPNSAVRQAHAFKSRGKGWRHFRQALPRRRRRYGR